MQGSLKNVTIATGSGGDIKDDRQGFIFSLLNPPVPLGGNIVSLDVYVDELPVPRKSIFVATSEEVVNASTLSDNRPIAFKPFQSARFLVEKEGGLEEARKHRITIVSKLEGFEEIAIPFTFSDRVMRHRRERIVVPPSPHEYAELAVPDGDTLFKNFTTPLVLSGKKAYIVCSANGALSANWTWMGVRYDNGGLYVPPTRAFGRIIVEVSMEDGVRKRLPNFVVSSRHEHGILYTHHELAGLHVRRKLTVPPESKGFVMVLDLDLANPVGSDLGRKGRRAGSDGRAKGKVKEKRPRRNVRLHFMIDGNITSYGLAAISQSNVTRFNAKDNCLQISSAGSGPAVAAGSNSNRRRRKKDRVQYFGTIGVAPKSLRPVKVLTDSFDNGLELSYDVEVEAGSTKQIALVATGGFTSAGECLQEFRSMRDDYGRMVDSTKRSFEEFSSSTLAVSSGGAGPEEQRWPSLQVTKLVRAYEKAKVAMQYLKAEYDGLGQGICAGLPRFPNYWARDTGWSLRGYLAIGDYRFARAVIDNFLRRQAKKAVQGATAGELPMIISGRAFLHNTTYGSADSTFLFPRAIRDYVLATGDAAYLRQRWDSVAMLIDCGIAKDIDGDGLVDHGFTGIAEKLPIKDSTWMDHIDRRKSANDVQALFYESLRIGSELAAIAGDSHSQKKWAQRADELLRLIDREYWNGDTNFYYDTIRRDGSKDPSIRPNALVLLLAGATASSEKAHAVLDRIEKEDMTAAWGVRTLSTQDSKYHPTLYHDGAVWPLVTGWAALAELAHGRAVQGLNYVNSMADRILAENGMFAETYRGDRPEPFNSCILQAWSVGMYACAVRELMFGMEVNMLENKIRFRPNMAAVEAATAAGAAGVRNTVTAEHAIEGPGGRGRGRLAVSVDPHGSKISVTLKNWQGARPEFLAEHPYDVVVTTAT